MVSTLSYSGSSASLSNQRAFDAWGNIRNSDTSGDPKGRYCASLGHKADDESGLTYMRARYYDPGCGRFVSEDPSLVLLEEETVVAEEAEGGLEG
jgi:RHS repeat-associated protein